MKKNKYWKDIVEPIKKIIPLIMLASLSALANPVKADITSRFASSVQLSVGGAHTSTDRIGSSIAISGSGIAVSYTHMTLPTKRIE